MKTLYYNAEGFYKMIFQLEFKGHIPSFHGNCYVIFVKVPITPSLMSILIKSTWFYKMFCEKDFRFWAILDLLWIFEIFILRSHLSFWRLGRVTSTREPLESGFQFHICILGILSKEQGLLLLNFEHWTTEKQLGSLEK